MNLLWAPWRKKYICSTSKEKGCFLCLSTKSKDDSKNYIVFRGKNSFVILNKYPYNNGHILIAPYRHIRDLDMLKENERTEIFDLIRLMLQVLRKTHKPEGFNLGLNLGKVAGAGVERHLHFHVVPRWVGDTNFMPVISETKVISESLKSTFNLLQKELKKLFKD